MKFLGKTKSKIYCKLFEFASVGSWSREEAGDYVSRFYNEYKLKITNRSLFWAYSIYKTSNRYNSDYNDTSEYDGFVKLTFFGKLVSVGIAFIVSFIIKLIFRIDFIDNQTFVYIFLPLLYLLSEIIPMIFNWKMYIAFRNIRKNIRNEIKLMEKEIRDRKKNSLKMVDDEIVGVINRTIGRDIRLAREIKLKRINRFFK